MKLISRKLAGSACLLAILATPLTGLANPGHEHDKYKHKDKPWSVAEPGTLAMTVAGLGLGMGLVLFGRRNRKRVTA